MGWAGRGEGRGGGGLATDEEEAASWYKRRMVSRGTTSHIRIMAGLIKHVKRISLSIFINIVSSPLPPFFHQIEHIKNLRRKGKKALFNPPPQHLNFTVSVFIDVYFYSPLPPPLNFNYEKTY